MFAKRIKDLREKNNLQQKDLAKELGVLDATISMWENGKRIPYSDMLIKIANYFGVSTDYLLGNIPKKSKEEEIEVLKQLLVENGYMKENEDLTDDELMILMKFIRANKRFIRDCK